jgi:dTDP-4-dehydrorhamnose reductase
VKILVLGGGQVARAVSAAAPGHHQLVVHTRTELDIVDEQAVSRTVAAIQPDWIVNAAAYTAVDLAEAQAAEAAAANDSAVGSLDRAAREVGGRLLHLSTDFVFDGRANRAYLTSDQTNPLSVYGNSKLGGERHVMQGGTGIVMRTSWVYAATGKNFVLTMLRLMPRRFGARSRAQRLPAFIIGPISVSPAGTISPWLSRKRRWRAVCCLAPFQFYPSRLPLTRRRPSDLHSACLIPHRHGLLSI